MVNHNNKPPELCVPVLDLCGQMTHVSEARVRSFTLSLRSFLHLHIFSIAVVGNALLRIDHSHVLFANIP